MGSLKVAFHGGAVLMHGDNYGTLTQWERDSAHRCDAIGFPRASLIIEAQAILMRFLHRSTEQLPQEVTNDSAEGHMKWDEIIHSGLKMNNSNTNWSKLVHQPFTAAPHLADEAEVQCQLGSSLAHANRAVIPQVLLEQDFTGANHKAAEEYFEAFVCPSC
jgi:hypothetical protein